MAKDFMGKGKSKPLTFGFEDRKIHELLHEYEFVNAEKFPFSIGTFAKPIPSFIPALLAWTFILVFPLIFLFDWRSRPMKVMSEDVVRLYLPIFIMAIIFGMNQVVLISKLFFKQKIKAYIGANLALLFFVIGLRELMFYVLDFPGSFYSIYLTKGTGYRLSEILLPIVVFLIFALLICLVNISFRLSANHTRFAYWVRQKQNEILQADLAFLKMQLSPHFLFNTLNNIAALMDIDIKKAQRSIIQLSTLLRTILYETKDDMISLKSEIMILEKYIELEKLRFGPNVDCRVEFSLENGQREVIPLLFMPLVENAVKHGVHPVRPSKVLISIVEKESQLICTVENTLFPRKKGLGDVGGIGLSNMQKRLDSFYAERYTYTSGIEGEMYKASLKINLL